MATQAPTLSNMSSEKVTDQPTALFTVREWIYVAIFILIVLVITPCPICLPIAAPRRTGSLWA